MITTLVPMMAVCHKQAVHTRLQIAMIIMPALRMGALPNQDALMLSLPAMTTILALRIIVTPKPAAFFLLLTATMVTPAHSTVAMLPDAISLKNAMTITYARMISAACQ